MSAEILKTVADQVAVCTKCFLHHSRKNAVPGSGPANSEIMLIGEGPGFHENEKGLPFVGPAGKFLDELLDQAGLKRSNVFITNVVKCRPPENRDPLPEELKACSEYLDRQISTIDPLVIVTLGRFSMAKFLPFARISEIHGKPQWVQVGMQPRRLIVPMYHPAAALHQPKYRPEIIEDFSHLSTWIEEARKHKQVKEIEEKTTHIEEPEKDDPEQLSLF